MGTSLSDLGDARTVRQIDAKHDDASQVLVNGSDPPDTTDDLPSDAQDVDALDLDDVFHILQNERRRQVLRHIKDVDGKVRMRDVAESIAAWENDTTVENLYSDQRQRVYIALYQSHLPKLDDLGVIEYNQSRGTIEPTPLVDDVIQYLDVSSESTPSDDLNDDALTSRWLGASLAPAAVIALIVAVTWIGLFPITFGGVVLGALMGAAAAAGGIMFSRTK